MSKIKSKYLDTGTVPGQVNDQAIPSTYTPTNYTPEPVGTENVNRISAHLKGIDEALSTAGGTKVSSLNTKTGDLTLEAGTNVTIDNSDPDKIVISSTGGSGETKYTQSLTETTQELNQPVLDISNSETSAKVEYTVKRVLPPEGSLENFVSNSAIFGGIYRSGNYYLYGNVGVGPTRTVLKSADAGQTWELKTVTTTSNFIQKAMYYSETHSRFYIFESLGGVGVIYALISSDGGNTFTSTPLTTGLGFATASVLSTSNMTDGTRLLVFFKDPSSNHHIGVLSAPTTLSITTIPFGSLPAGFDGTSGTITSMTVFSDPYFAFLVQDGKLFSLSGTTLTRIFPSDTTFSHLACKPGVSAVCIYNGDNYMYYNGSTWTQILHTFPTTINDLIYVPEKDLYIAKDNNNTFYTTSTPQLAGTWSVFTPKDSEDAATTNGIVYGNNRLISYRRLTTQLPYRVYEGVEQRKVIQSGSFRAIADVGYTPIITSEESGGDDAGVSFSATQDVNDIMVEATLVDENQLSSEIKYTIKKL